MTQWQVIGQQRFRVEDDMVYWEVKGDVTAQELAHIFGDMGPAVQAVHGYALFLVSIVGPWSFPPAARQWLAQFHKRHNAVGATAVVGASLSMRLFIDLVLRAIALVVSSAPTTRFFRTSEEAISWFAELRVLGKQGRLTR